MGVYVVTTNYLYSGVFGIYSSIKRARIALERFITEDECVISFEDLDDYSYQFTTMSGKTFIAEIYFDVLDEEFEAGTCKEDE